MCKTKCECPVIEEDITASASLTRDSSSVDIAIIEITSADSDSKEFLTRLDTTNSNLRITSTIIHSYDTRSEASAQFDIYLSVHKSAGFVFTPYED